MGVSYIITDSAAQFTRPSFTGNKFLKIINYKSEIKTDGFLNVHQLKIADFPRWIGKSGFPNLLPPDVSSVNGLITSFYQSVDNLFIILVSNGVFPAYQSIEPMVTNLHGRACIHLIDSQSVSIGEGLIVQSAAALASQGIPGAEIEEKLRKAIPRIYTLLCTTNLTYLHKAGYIDAGQAIAGEMFSILPIFAIEDGHLNPLDKVKNTRSVIEYFIEFIDEFEQIESVSLINQIQPNTSETRMVRLHLEEYHPGAEYTEHSINPFLASLIGPRGMGIVIKEKV